MKIKIDFIPYYEWYAKLVNWEKLSVDDFINGKIKNPFSMFSEWLDIISIKPDKNSIGKEVYYSLNAEHRDTITYDTYLEGCVIKKGIITDISENTLQIDGRKYNYSKYNTVLFDKPEYCILYLHYDGVDIFEGNELLPMFKKDLFDIEIKETDDEFIEYK